LEFARDVAPLSRLVALRVRPAGAPSLEIRRVRGRGGPFELLVDGQSRGVARRAGFEFTVNRFLPFIGAEPPRRGRPSGTQAQSRTAARALLDHLARDFREVRAMGAFRLAPARQYRYAGPTSETDDPVINSLLENSVGKRARKTLGREVNRRLHQVGRVRLLPIRAIAQKARLDELRLRDLDARREANYADVGFGIGQALPVLVEGLRTPPGGTFLVQEPEIHLHPDAQLAMADFLVSLVRSGRRVIAETHSEPLLLRVRHRILGSNGNGGLGIDRSQVSILHVAANPDGSSSAQAVTIDELGDLQRWPAGFMGETTQERMHILQAKARRAEQGES
jgi:hypothetical protein